MLPSLFELKDNGTIVMSTIIKTLQYMSRIRGLLISEVGKIVRLLEKIDGTFSALKRIKTTDYELWETTDGTP